MNSSSSCNTSNTVPHGDPQDFLPATVHAIFALKSMAHAAKSNPAYLPHLIGIAQTIDVNEFANFSSMGAPISSDKGKYLQSLLEYLIICNMPSNNVLLKALSLGVVAESVRSPIESMTIPHESYRTVPVSSSTNNTYTSNGMSRDPIIGNEPDLQLLETHCKLQASGFPIDYSCQSIPDHKRASIPTTRSIFSSSDMPPLPKKARTVPVSSSTNNNYIDVSSPITSLLVLDLYIKKCLSTYTTSVLKDRSSSITEGKSIIFPVLVQLYVT
jgi:hypothetical protein|tara:strand:+ start:853 stop:1665 length:813 start_codon:yes stop_codon:yes gene_type:complete